MRLLVALPVLGLAFVATSCRGSRDSATGWLAGEGKPVNLALTFDPANGAAKVITPRGGDISTSGADGTLYQLHIPAGALLSDERISLIPITAVKGLPLKGGSLAAVHLKPEGLRLLKPATLHIGARTEVPLAEQVAFAYFENGRDAHLYPISRESRDRSRIDLPILHFSGYGFGRAAPNDPGRIALQQAADKEARLGSWAAEMLSRERAKVLLGIESGTGMSDQAAAVLASLHLQWYKEVLRPIMKIAETDERMAHCAMTRYLAWERQMALLGCTDDSPPLAGQAHGAGALDEAGRGSSELERLRAEASVSAEKIAANYKAKFGKRFIKQCREQHDVSALSDYIVAALMLARQAALLGADDETDLAAVIREPSKDPIIAEILRCLSFELEFRSVFATKTADGDVSQHYDVRSKVAITEMPITAEGFALFFTPARAPLKYAAFSFSSVSANREITTAGIGTRESELTVFRLSFAQIREKMQQTNCAGQDEWTEHFVADTVFVTLSPGKPVELVRATALGFSSVTEGSGWLRMWNVFRQPEKLTDDASYFSDAEGSDMYTLKLRRVSPGTWRADFKYKKNDDLGSESEDSYVILRHTPK